jgi:hypothetical protein
LTDSVTCLVSPNNSKVEWSVNESVAVSEIDPALERDQTVTLGMILGCVGRTYQMCCGKRRGGGNIAGFVVLQPETLICCIVPNVIVMECEEFYKEAAILEARQRKSRALVESNAYQAPFACGGIGVGVSNKEEFVI